MGSMITVSLRFYEELNDFLPQKRRRVSFQINVPQPTSVKDLIESCGVPHSEVDLILANSESVTFDYTISDGDIISVYPVFESLDVSGAVRLQGRPLRHLQFVADTHLGQLARKLRLLGFDVSFEKRATREDLIAKMLNENRVILTTDRRLLMRKLVNRGYCVRNTDSRAQALSVVLRFNLLGFMNPLTRCMVCNGLVLPVDKMEVTEQLLPKTRESCNEFTRCDQCGKIYWKGSHAAGLAEFIEWIRGEARKTRS